jgi:hypothetical protein
MDDESTETIDLIIPNDPHQDALATSEMSDASGVNDESGDVNDESGDVNDESGGVNDGNVVNEERGKDDSKDSEENVSNLTPEMYRRQLLNIIPGIINGFLHSIAFGLLCGETLTGVAFIVKDVKFYNTKYVRNSFFL